MENAKCPDVYLPWYVAWDCNFLPDVDCKHENLEASDDQRMIILGSNTINSRCLFICQTD